MAKKSDNKKSITKKVAPKEIIVEEKNGQKPIVIKETEEDMVLGVGFSGSVEDFKDEVKKEAERNAFIKRFLIPLFVFLLVGALVGFATWYYSNKEEAKPAPAENKIQTPPVIEDSEKNKEQSIKTVPAVVTPAVSSPTTEKKDTTYSVKEGDTMSSIANANNMTSTELASYNGITDVNTLKIGQVLKIPVK